MLRFQTVEGKKFDYCFKWTENNKCTCRILTEGDKKNPGTLVAEDNSSCNPSDQFVKDVGRKIAFARALKKANFSRPDRAEAWQSYFKRK